MDAESLIDLLEQQWSLPNRIVSRIAGGMNSVTFAVGSASADQPTHIAKWVSGNLADELVAGCRTAQVMASHGMAAGDPIATEDGRLAAPVEAGAVALLRYVRGRALEGGNDYERRLMGETLGRVHTISAIGRRRGGFDNWLIPTRSETLRVPWLAAALVEVKAEFDGLPDVTWSTLHTDPAPEAFRLDSSTGEVGVIDWTGSRPGPALYDIASAVMYLGGADVSAEFLMAYLATGAVSPTEMVHLDSLRRFRWGVQAQYFARRLARNDRVGLAADPDGNQRGLTDARHGLESLGVRCRD
jgi:Ser/Thr protein kinase RdoA (MazF antagonist)